MDIDWRTVKDAEVRHIRGLLRKRNLDGITRIGIDEVSYEKGHKYLTLVTDLDGHRVIYATHGNDGKAVTRFVTWLGKSRCRRIKVVVTDMHDPYLKVLRSRLPKAALVFDHFHVSKIVHDALDEIRRRLQRELPPEGRRIIKGQRYVLLRARENLWEDPYRVSSVGLQGTAIRGSPRPCLICLQGDQPAAAGRHGHVGKRLTNHAAAIQRTVVHANTTVVASSISYKGAIA
jgi:transposase